MSRTGTKTILLFDMDGVLLKPIGYHRALQDTVILMGRSLGFPGVNIRQEEINYFEAMGVTSEWDSAAICTAILLKSAWEFDPDLNLPANPVALEPRSLPIDPPDFLPFYQGLAQEPDPDVSPLMRTERMLLNHGHTYSPSQINSLRRILRQARSIEASLTHRLFQEMVLGSQVFNAVYHLDPYLHVDSYLQQFDRPLLSPAARSSLHAWLADADHYGAIFTNRPSHPPQGSFSTPEAEMGAETAGFTTLPVVGLGGLGWLAEQDGLEDEAYLKPSPVHVLAALWLAINPPLKPLEPGQELEAALTSAREAAAGNPHPTWETLRGAQLYIYEDTLRGLKSARAAQERLQELGIPVHPSMIGISDSPPKQLTLKRFGAEVFPDLQTALQSAGIISTGYD